MLSIRLRIAILVGIVLYFAFIIRLIHKKTLNLKYALLWFLTGIAMVIVMLFPGIAGGFSYLLGIRLPINAVFIIGGFFCLTIILSLTAIVSKQTERIRDLTQKIALLDKELRELKKDA